VGTLPSHLEGKELRESLLLAHHCLSRLMHRWLQDLTRDRTRPPPATTPEELIALKQMSFESASDRVSTVVSSASEKELLERDALNVFAAMPVQGSVVVECNKTLYTVVKMTDGQACIIIDGSTTAQEPIDPDELFESYPLVRTSHADLDRE
jgi:tRNA uridine 5-carbamoylmethylation protein Kti12